MLSNINFIPKCLTPDYIDNQGGYKATFQENYAHNPRQIQLALLVTAVGLYGITVHYLGKAPMAAHEIPLTNLQIALIPGKLLAEKLSLHFGISFGHTAIATASIGHLFLLESTIGRNSPCTGVACHDPQHQNRALKKQGDTLTNNIATLTTLVQKQQQIFNTRTQEARELAQGQQEALTTANQNLTDRIEALSTLVTNLNTQAETTDNFLHQFQQASQGSLEALQDSIQPLAKQVTLEDLIATVRALQESVNKLPNGDTALTSSIREGISNLHAALNERTQQAATPISEDLAGKLTTLQETVARIETSAGTAQENQGSLAKISSQIKDLSAQVDKLADIQARLLQSLQDRGLHFSEKKKT